MLDSPPKRTGLNPLQRQINVIHALIIREMLTRFGSSRIGYLWIFGEPIILATMISSIHYASGSHLPNDLPTFLFYAMGYVPFVMFRTIVSRGASAIKSNMSLLFHRSITLFDVTAARNFLEMMISFTVVLIFQVFAVIFFGEVLHSPIGLIGGLLLSALLANGLGMLLAAFQVFWDPMERFVHPLTYLLMPISATFYMVSMMPPETRNALLWNPLVHVHELNRWAQFGDRIIAHYDIGYVLIWVLGLNILGLAGLRAARPRLSIMDD